MSRFQFFPIWNKKKNENYCHRSICHPEFSIYLRFHASGQQRIHPVLQVLKLLSTVSFLGVDTRSVETTFGMEENMQMYHSLRCKQIDMSTADQLKSIFPKNAGTPKLILVESRRKMHVLVERMNIECEESFTPREVHSSILQAHTGFINSEPFSSESYERNFEWTSYLSVLTSKAMNQT